MSHSVISLGLGLGGGKFATSSGATTLLAPVITSSAATNVTSDGATMNGTLTSTGGSDPTVTLYWGTVDRGESSFGWNGGSNAFGSRGVGALAHTVSGLSPPSTTFYYRFRAVNSAGTAWTGAQSFQTLADGFNIDVRLTQADIYARSGDAVGVIAYGTDTYDLYVFDGSQWQIYENS